MFYRYPYLGAHSPLTPPARSHLNRFGSLVRWQASQAIKRPARSTARGAVVLIGRRDVGGVGGVVTLRRKLYCHRRRRRHFQGAAIDALLLRCELADIVAGLGLQLQDEVQVDLVEGGVDAPGGDHNIVDSVDGAERVVAPVKTAAREMISCRIWGSVLVGTGF
ncbi:uncharacterized protein LAJ45_02967 [Morchella importuna]|uniref:uncharacterized protein n=1 Tax=Morchella importuna TaxID=1174673 RepID=UPI001E8E2792|nr:uncharacterized protein LAJ45_02967 [Morchella importuna]KAH8152743.1 hypothetical protein LAJ45_02967 [Morchella importuna]